MLNTSNLESTGLHRTMAKVCNKTTRGPSPERAGTTRLRRLRPFARRQPAVSSRPEADLRVSSRSRAVLASGEMISWAGLQRRRRRSRFGFVETHSTKTHAQPTDAVLRVKTD